MQRKFFLSFMLMSGLLMAIYVMCLADASPPWPCYNETTTQATADIHRSHHTNTREDAKAVRRNVALKPVGSGGDRHGMSQLWP